LVVGSFVVGAAFLATFIWWERHTPRPMLDVRIFKNPRFSAASATITLTQFAMFGTTFLLTQYFQFRLGYSPLKSGIMLMPVAIGLMVGSPNAPKLVHRFGTTRVVVVGLLAVSAATALYTSDALMSSFAIGFGIRLIYGLGMGITMAPVTESIMGSLPRERAGVGSAINDTTRQTGGALGVAVLGSLFAFQYHRVIDTTAGVSASVLHHARDSIGRSLEEAQKLGGAAGAHLTDAAQHAFVSSMRITFGFAALVVLFAAIVAARFLPARAEEVGGETMAEEVAESLVVGVETAT
jgi:predicted MFS family arabinose efflux permease